MKRWVLVAVALIFSVTFGATPSRAESIDFLGGSGGTMAFTPGTGNTLTISGVPMDLVFLSSVGLGGAAVITDGSLALTSGGADAGGTLSTTTVGTFETTSYSGTFGGGGTLEIIGGIADFGIASGTSLLSAVFADFPGGTSTSLSYTIDTLTGTVFASTGFFGGILQVQSINEDLLLGLGMLPSLTSGFGSIAEALINVSWDGDSFTGSVGSTNIAVTPVSEPASLLLMGSGLLAGAAMLKRKFLKVRNKA